MARDPLKILEKVQRIQMMHLQLGMSKASEAADAANRKQAEMRDAVVTGLAAAAATDVGAWVQRARAEIQSAKAAGDHANARLEEISRDVLAHRTKQELVSTLRQINADAARKREERKAQELMDDSSRGRAIPQAFPKAAEADTEGLRPG